jgi:type IV secretion system protein VirB10
MSDANPPDGLVRGERAAAAVARVASIHSRLSSVLALSVMSALGLGSLAWYYAHAMTRQSRERQSAQAASISRAQAEMPLPAIGRIDPPAPLESVTPELPPGGAATASGTPIVLREVPLAGLSGAPPAQAAAVPPGKSPAQLALERELSGAVFVPQASGAVAEGGSGGEAGAAPGSVAPAQTKSSEALDLTPLLSPGVRHAARAEILPGLRLLLPKGAFIDCTLETAIDSTLPGMTTCVTATDTFGADGRVVLLERGTKLVGETKGEVQQGAARLFVLWTEARTPTGVIVPLASPGADELGRSGLSGSVNRHFWQRFGAAMLVSVLDGAVQAAVQSRGAGGTVILNPTAAAGVTTEVLKGTINIAPTIVKRQGERIQVLVARDLDFRSVYALRSAARSP